MRQSSLTGQRLTAVFLAGVMFYFSPLISLFDQTSERFGIPTLYLYLFGVWVVLIALMAWIIEGHRQ
ncbi:MAG: hypothetical protein GY703_12030 [Gammaproteobacteria bacterium]|nr:hypothetical protein [Gammaproteobacteria bacterium]